MPDERIAEFAKKLHLSERALKVMWDKFRFDHGEEAEAKLLKHLRDTYEEKRDHIRLLGRHSGYVESYFGAIQVRSAEVEPEAIPAALQEEYADNARNVFGVLKGEELARKQTRSRLERLRQAEIDLRKKGKPTEAYIATIEQVVKMMERDSRA